MRRIGIFGGTFNPPHIAHLIHAESVSSQMSLDKILFIPSGNPPLKFTDIIPAEHRLNMARLAFTGNSNFEVSDIEIKALSLKSYTVDTLKKLFKIYEKKETKLFLIIGMDNLLDLPKWKSPEKLFSYCDVLVINRPGYEFKDAPKEFLDKVTYISVPSLEISSTMIRKMVNEKKSIKYLVPESVRKYIVQNKLYI
ncbi:MAG: nicotinate-nucleotide adenylyltransferase [Ignavibacteria bacterium]|nr:nicotinate-nucleotide adenylyltransferase [Ignavibacteria bacterium]